MLPPIFLVEVTLITERPLRALVQFLRDTNAPKVLPSQPQSNFCLKDREVRDKGLRRS